MTKTTKDRMRMQSNFSSLCKGNLIPKEVRDQEGMRRFLEAVAQFQRIINDSGYIKMHQLDESEIVGVKEQSGLLENYFTLSREKKAALQDLALGAEELRIGNKRMVLHTLSDTDDLPGAVSESGRYDRLSTDKSDCMLSFASPVGLMLACDHIYNQYLFIDNSADNLKKFEKSPVICIHLPGIAERIRSIKSGLKNT